MNSVTLALKCNHRHVHRLYLLDEDGRSRRKRVLDLHSLEETAKARDIPIEYLSKSTMNQMVGGNNTQGVVLEAGPVHVPIIHEPPPLTQSSSEDPPLIVALDEVHDTHNFGEQ
jgi:tRNA G18 (ribose-2'-O)-methylase SpoU